MDRNQFRKRETTERLLVIRTADAGTYRVTAENRTEAMTLGKFLATQPDIRVVSLWNLGQTTIDAAETFLNPKFIR